MGILKYKYKAHKLVNTLFYVIVFGVGFLLGFGAEKIDYSKLISQVLMIDSVKAYDMTSTSNSSDTVDEGYVINAFENLFDTFDYSEVPYITCYFTTNFPLTCIAMNENLFNSLYIYNSSTAMYGIAHNAVENATYYKMRIKSGLSYEVINSVVNTDLNALTNNVLLYIYPQGSGYTKWKSFANFNPSDIDSRMTSINSKVNVLDFSQYAIPEMIYNENLFKDNPDFKEVCVNNYDTFSITTNEIQTYGDDGTPMYHGFDFMWFPNGMKGISTWGYDSEEHDHVYLFEKSENTFSGWWYWLNTREEIDLYFGRDNPGMYLELKGYKNKYDYYNYTFYPFEMTLTESYHRYQVFWFKDPYIEYLDGTIKNDSEKYCFYIKNEFDVNILTKNANGDFNSSITILGGINKDDVTYENELNNNSNGFFSTVNNFISKIRPTVMFINTHILELYTSMPLIVRSFILSFLVLIIIRILIGMVVR